IDARGLELFTCTLIDISGTEKRSQALVDVRELRQLVEDLGRLERLAADGMRGGPGFGGPIGPEPGPPLSQLDTEPALRQAIRSGMGIDVPPGPGDTIFRS
ncbi:MAG TPA: hypothetical protein VGC99_25740, partial [Candidatus Tectomicrobia bacterium]